MNILSYSVKGKGSTLNYICESMDISGIQPAVRTLNCNGTTPDNISIAIKAEASVETMASSSTALMQLLRANLNKQLGLIRFA